MKIIIVLLTALFSGSFAWFIRSRIAIAEKHVDSQSHYRDLEVRGHYSFSAGWDHATRRYASFYTDEQYLKVFGVPRED